MDDLDIPFPPAHVVLSGIEHPLIKKAQHLPGEAAVGGAERIKSLTDRTWFKCKIVNLRGAGTELGPEESSQAGLLDEADAWWWLGAAGERKDDSAADFYKLIKAEAVKYGKGTAKGVSTQHLLPAEIDYKRLTAEVSFATNAAFRSVVRSIVAQSIRTGHVLQVSFSGHLIKASVRAADEEAYLAVAAEGFTDPTVIAVILGALQPEIPASNWQPEPGGKMGVEVGYGQIVFSTIISAEAQAALLDECPTADESQAK